MFAAARRKRRDIREREKERKREREREKRGKKEREKPFFSARYQTAAEENI